MANFDILISTILYKDENPIPSLELARMNRGLQQRYKFYDQKLHLDKASRPYRYLGILTPASMEYVPPDLSSAIKFVEKGVEADEVHNLSFGTPRIVKMRLSNWGVDFDSSAAQKYTLSASEFLEDAYRIFELIYIMCSELYGYNGPRFSVKWDNDTLYKMWDDLWAHIDDTGELSGR